MERRVKLGDVEFTVIENEKPRDSVTITDNSVESGQDVSDHVKQNPSIIEVSGQMIGDDASDKLNTLKKYQKEGKLLKYVGRNVYDNMAIQSIDRDHGVRNRYGFGFNITLKQVRIATAKEVEIKVVDPASKLANKKTSTKVKPTTNNGKQQPQMKATVVTRADVVMNSLQEGAKSPGGTMKAIVSLYNRPITTRGGIAGGGGSGGGF